MGRAANVDPAAGLRQPHLYPEAIEHGRHLSELITRGERTLVLADHNRVEPALLPQRRQQRTGLRPLRPRHATRAPRIEEHCRDGPVAGDHGLGHLTLPAA
jgi:hypothetical protein